MLFQKKLFQKHGRTAATSRKFGSKAKDGLQEQTNKHAISLHVEHSVIEYRTSKYTFHTKIYKVHLMCKRSYLQSYMNLQNVILTYYCMSGGAYVSWKRVDNHMNFLGELKHPCRHDAQNMQNDSHTKF